MVLKKMDVARSGVVLDETLLTGMVFRLHPIVMMALVRALGGTALLLASGSGFEI